MTERSGLGGAGVARRGETAEDASPFTLAHLSDLHATEVRIESPRDILGKRALGWLSWRRKRRKEHLAAVLEALAEDLAACKPDHVGVTGDLTHLGLASEVEAAVGWLERFGRPSGVSVVPGNHDAYAGSPGAERWSPWADYRGPVEPAEDDSDDPATAGFPWVRRLGSVALVGVSTARPTAPLLATGRVGAGQLSRLERLLARLGREGLVRVVMMHHPPVSAGLSRRRRLDDAAEIRAVLARAGAELVLHGHTHESHRDTVAGPRGAIPVIGVPSSSSIGHRPARRARYHLYRIARARQGGRALSCQVRGYDPAARRFVPEAEFDLG
jgi:3',5'-cyclic AMP phosphodiesterase CpdA